MHYTPQAVTVVRAKRIALIIALPVLLSAARLSGASTIDYVISDQTQQIPQTAVVGAQHVSIKSVGGDPSRDLLFDAAHQVLSIIDHGKRSYLQIDQATIDEFAAWMESFKRTVGPSSGKLAEALEKFGVMGRSAPIETTDTGSELRIGGYPCRLFRSQAAGEAVSEICIASNATLKLGPSDLDTLRTFLVFGQQMLLHAERLLTMLGVTLPQLAVSNDGLPIGAYIENNQVKVRLKQIELEEQPAVSFAIPDGYTRTRVPFAPG